LKIIEVFHSNAILYAYWEYINRQSPTTPSMMRCDKFKSLGFNRIYSDDELSRDVIFENLVRGELDKKLLLKTDWIITTVCSH